MPRVIFTQKNKATKRLDNTAERPPPPPPPTAEQIKKAKKKAANDIAQEARINKRIKEVNAKIGGEVTKGKSPEDDDRLFGLFIKELYKKTEADWPKLKEAEEFVKNMKKPPCRRTRAKGYHKTTDTKSRNALRIAFAKKHGKATKPLSAPAIMRRRRGAPMSDDEWEDERPKTSKEERPKTSKEELPKKSQDELPEKSEATLPKTSQAELSKIRRAKHSERQERAVTHISYFGSRSKKRNRDNYERDSVDDPSPKKKRRTEMDDLESNLGSKWEAQIDENGRRPVRGTRML